MMGEAFGRLLHNHCSVTYSAEIVEQIQKKHALAGAPSLLPSTGMVNEAWELGENYVLRINLHEECDDESAREALVVPLVRSAGVRTPELVVYDNDRDIVPRPYTIYRRAPGVLLGNLDIDPTSLGHLYEEIGREMALLHRMPAPESHPLIQAREKSWDARNQIQKVFDNGLLSEEDFDEIQIWLSFVEPMLGGQDADTLVHKDIHPWNLIVEDGTYQLSAILDWGDARMGDVATEFASMPLCAVSGMLRGYESAGEVVTESLIAKSMYYGLGLAGWEIRDGDMQSYKRIWWRMPLDGWQGFKRCFAEEFPFLLPAELR